MTLYDTLGVEPGASRDEIREAYLTLARHHHPDAGGSAARMRDLNRAWAVLGDEAQRRDYDRELRRPDEVDDDIDDFDDLGDSDEYLGATFAEPLDDRPLSAHTSMGMVVVLPPGLFAASVVTFSGAVVMSSPGLIGVAFMLFVLSLLAFAMITLFALHRSAHRGKRAR